MAGETKTSVPSTALVTEADEKHPIDRPSMSRDGKDENPDLTVSDTDAETAKTTVATAPDEAETEEVKGFKLFAIMAALTLVCFLMLLDMSIIATAIPRITTEFHSLRDVGWYGSAYQLASACLQPLSGKLYTYFTPKWMITGFTVLFVVGSLICGVATSSTMLILGRAVAGLGTSGIQNGALTIIAQCVPLHKRPALIGIIMGIGQLGIVSGPLLGGAITEYSTWRWCFYINLPIGAASILVLVLTKIPDHTKKIEKGTLLNTIVPKLDLPGFVIFSPAAVMFLLALQFGPDQERYGWGSATVIGLFVGSIVLLGIFFLWEWREGANAMIPLGMVAQREIWTSMLVMLLIMGGLMMTNSFYLPIYFQSVLGKSPLMSGVYLLPGIFSNTLLAVGTGFLIGKMGYYTPWALFSGVISSVGQGLLTTLSPSTDLGKLIGYQFLSGAGRGAGLQMPMLAVQAVLPPEQISVGMAVLSFSQIFGSAVLLTVSNTIFDSSLQKKLAEFLPNIDPLKIIAAGAVGMHEIVSDAELPKVREAYSESINNVFYLATASGILIFFLAWGMGWKDIRQKKKPEPADV